MVNQTVAWTPVERDEWIEYCANSYSDVGTLDGYTFVTKMKAETSYEQEEEGFVTSCLASTFFDGRRIYKLLVSKILQNSFLRMMYDKQNFAVIVCDSIRDVKVIINPELDYDLFEQIRSSLVVLVSQVMSRYKKDLDATLFNDKSQASVEKFKELYTSMVSTLPTGDILSPFENDKVRNACSIRSYMKLDSEVDEAYVVCVQVPHLPRCEYIPLRKTPIELCYDETLDGAMTTKLRLNNIVLEPSVAHEKPEPEVVWTKVESDEDGMPVYSLDISAKATKDIKAIKAKREFDPTMEYSVVGAELVGVSILYQDNIELQRYWKKGRFGVKRCYPVYDEELEMNVLMSAQ